MINKKDKIEYSKCTKDYLKRIKQAQDILDVVIDNLNMCDVCSSGRSELNDRQYVLKEIIDVLSEVRL